MKQHGLTEKLLIKLILLLLPSFSWADVVDCTLGSTPIKEVNLSSGIDYSETVAEVSLPLSLTKPSDSDNISLQTDSEGTFTLITISASSDSPTTLKNISVSVRKTGSNMDRTQQPIEAENDDEVTLKFQTADFYYRVLCTRQSD